MLEINKGDESFCQCRIGSNANHAQKIMNTSVTFVYPNSAE